MSENKKDKQALIEEIHGSIDLGFSDYYEDQNVRDRTLDAHALELHHAVELLTLKEAINYSLRPLGIYFACAETDPQKYQQWKLDAFQAPIGGRLIGQLLTKPRHSAVSSS
jgi:hypothetical protein